MTQQVSLTDMKKDAAAGSAVAPKAKADNFPAMLDVYKKEIARALPSHLSADRMARIALTCFRQSPKLGECDHKSVFAAVIQAAQLGLEPGLMGHAYLVPYGRTCQLIPGYQGLIDLALRSGRVKSIAAHAVHENDEFDYQYGDSPFLKHKPSLGDRGQIKAFYACAKLDTGDVAFEVMSKMEVDAIAAKTQSRGKSGPWADYYSEMGRKTAIRRLFKYLPKSVEMATAMTLDAVAADGKGQNLSVDSAIEGTWVPVVDEDGVVTNAD
jgi:recombination protein RecT